MDARVITKSKKVITKICEICNKPFSKYPSYFNKRAGRFCSNKCKLIAKSEEWKRDNPIKYIDNSGKNNPMWNKKPHNYNENGSERKDGYIRITINKKRVLKHRYIMEKFLNRKLFKNEIIHHIDGNNKNNELKNLIILTQSEHSKLHNKNGRFSKINCGGTSNCNSL